MKHSTQLWRVGAILILAMVVTACTQPASMNGARVDVPSIAPKGTVSLEYPNQWDINKLIALSNDGSRLIDATEDARYIRVWDWGSNKVAQRLLLNEKAPEESDGKSHHELTLKSSLGQELALSPDGRMVAACLRREKMIRVWNLDSGAIVTEIPSLQRHVPGLDQEMIFGLACDSINFSPDGKYMAVLFKLGSYNNNESDFNAYMENSANIGPNNRGLYYKKRMTYEELRAQMYYPVHISGIALFETNDWKLEKLFYRATPQQTFNSRPLFDPESKTVSAVVFNKAPPNPNWHRLGWEEWAGNRIVRWDIATGAQLNERDLGGVNK